MRHKKRYSVSKAQRITDIITTEKLTYRTVLYSITKGTKGSVSCLTLGTTTEKNTVEDFNISHDTNHPCVKPQIT